MRAAGTMNLCTVHAILALTLVILAACSPTPVPDDDQAPGQAPGGGMIEKVNSDAADCRKQTRAMAGRNPSAWYDRAYSDCMAGRGYKPDSEQMK
jgi:hypothetical protein